MAFSLLERADSVIVFLPYVEAAVVKAISDKLRLVAAEATSFHSTRLLVATIGSSTYMASDLFDAVAVLSIYPGAMFAGGYSAPELGGSTITRSRAETDSELGEEGAADSAVR